MFYDIVIAKFMHLRFRNLCRCMYSSRYSVDTHSLSVSRWAIVGCCRACVLDCEVLFSRHSYSIFYKQMRELWRRLDTAGVRMRITSSYCQKVHCKNASFYNITAFGNKMLTSNKQSEMKTSLKICFVKHFHFN